MFNSLTGTITGKFPQKLFLENNGIEWDICVPDSSLDKLPSVGQTGKVYTWLQHTDVLMNLYGFSSENERTLFFDLLKVDGIGPKAALKIMSNITSNGLAQILDSGDLDALQKVPGVGKKTAAKMLLQLKGKLSLSDAVDVVPRKIAVPYADVVEALASMGYDRRNCEEAVSKVVSELEKSSDFESKPKSEKEDAIFRMCLVEMAR